MQVRQTLEKLAVAYRQNLDDARCSNRLTHLATPR